MKIIDHRRNTLELLAATPTNLGVEIDLRSEGSRIIVQHDPFKPGVDFDEWLASYAHDTLILNVKEEGLEEALIERMRSRGIADWFFLDQSFPFLVKTARNGESRCAVRVSEYESIETALALAGKIDWAWVDCFTRFPLSADDAQRLVAAGFQLCVVSPELQGRDPETEIAAMRRTIADLGAPVAAVCTKRPDLWAD